ncbi:NAD(P)/FAD-dependent oxidoreductase [Streptomyces sp. HNM0574]|uniref:flavin-containing monooxygenase n=1 Tax=Streptomyces sp. HNM0574 TaxID=2714954 RepID=UPI00146C0F63|nr:NAD(P)/FAD-dependent oxidoreductase [Streptomyces sp. HNM0574]NLU67771.1 NAD(P)/FAD-dependent oxidoreductase [Streptomyces sp. HNM0574]
MSARAARETEAQRDGGGAGYDVIVVGAGFSGLYLLHRLRELGLRTLVLEEAEGVGGTWYWNRYPGARCDVPSLYYSYSFSPELEQEWEWSERYPGQPELLRYLEHVADRFALWPDIRLGTRVSAAHFDETAGRWRVRTADGAELAATYCVMATGCLSRGKLPELPGLDDFAGPAFHTARWPHEGVDFTGQHVGVIGTGSSGVQAIPRIAEQAARVTVFQRTPNFAVPAHNRPLDPAEQAAVKSRYAQVRADARLSGFGPLDLPPEGGSGVRMPTESALEVDAEERERRYRRAWDEGTLVSFLTTFTDMLTDQRANDTAADYVRARLRGLVDDPATAEALTPRGHPFGTKRPCLESGYYAAFNQPHVRLVDLRATPLTRITPDGVATSDGEHPVDSLVFATGFDAMTGALRSIDIRGRDGLALRDKWADGPRTYLGVATAGFPNLFLMTGPGSPSVLTNMVVSIEQHVEWITDFLARLTADGTPLAEAEPDAEAAWSAHVDEVAAATLYPRARSWYTGSNIPGKPHGFMPYAGGVTPYREKCDEVAARGYAGFRVE